MKQISKLEASILFDYGVTIGLGARRKGAKRADIKAVSRYCSRTQNLREAINFVEFCRANQNRKPIRVTEFYVY